MYARQLSIAEIQYRRQPALKDERLAPNSQASSRRSVEFVPFGSVARQKPHGESTEDRWVCDSPWQQELTGQGREEEAEGESP